MNQSNKQDDDADMVVIEIGGKGHLGDETIREMASAPALVHMRYPNASIGLAMHGYDDDPREIWDIPEAADYVRRYAAASGLHNWLGFEFAASDESSKGVLIACKAIDEPHPFTLQITE